MAAPHSSIHEIDKHISDTQDTLSSSPRSSSPRLRLRWQHYHLSDDEQDLETSIIQSTHAIFLPIEGGPNIIFTFFSLSMALCLRSFNLSQPNADIKYTVQYLHYIREQSFEGFHINCNQVNYFLVVALRLQLQLEPRAGDAMQGIDEMSMLCRELLASDISPQDLSAPIHCLASAVSAFLSVSSPLLSQQLMECLCEANMRFPDSVVVSLTLSRSFMNQFYATKSKADYESSMALLDKIIASHSPPCSPDQYVNCALFIAATLAEGRFGFYANPEYLEEAIIRHRAYLNTTSSEDPYHRSSILRLEELEKIRFDEFGVTNGLPELHSSSPEVVDAPSFSDLAASLSKSNTVGSPSMTHQDKRRHINALSSMLRITDKVAIEEGVKYCRLLLPSLKQNLDDSAVSAPMTHLTTLSLGTFLRHAFLHTHNPEYLNDSIDIFHDMLKLPGAQFIHFWVIFVLISCLFIRLRLSKDSKVLDEIMDLYRITTTDTYANVPERFKMSFYWAQLARNFMHTSTPNAYESAISLMHDSLAFSPTLEIQHFRLITKHNSYQKLPLDYASYLIITGQLKQAIETLERGRGLLWSEMRGLHTAVDQIHIVDSHLARRFAAVNQDLEALTTSSSPSVPINDGEGKKMDPFGRLVVEQRKLLDERNGLIAQVRSLPGLGNFLIALSFDTLRCAAARGPVVIINHSERRSDIIILLYDTPPNLVPTPHNFYDRGKGLRDQLLTARKEGLDSTEYEDALTSVLESLYDLIGRPAIQKLNELNVPEQSRIWWCPTSVFCSLPLHAMGPIRSDGPHNVYFSDLYIPSYTPTLTALVESRKPGLDLFRNPSILLVAQPDESMPGSRKEVSLIRRLKTKVTTLISKEATPSAVVEGLKDHRFAHFSCHGILDTGKPFDACFKLHGGERLTLLGIIRSRLPSAEFAFLAACHTAELTEESIADEGLHLTAAVQYSGFRSVVGTMWAMADIDGCDLARSFYGSVFSGRWEDVPYHERTAEALRDAVKVLRSKRNMSTERWVNFVHYGA